MSTLRQVKIRRLNEFEQEPIPHPPLYLTAWPVTVMTHRLTFRIVLFAILASLLGFCLPQDHFGMTTKSNDFPDLYEASIAELQDGLSAGLFSSVDLVKVGPLLRGPTLVDMLSVFLGIFCSDRGGQLTRADS